ncbi:MAG: 3TM-type holin [Acidobacteriota bacterium]
MASLISDILGGNALSGLASLINAIRGKDPALAAKLEQIQVEDADKLRQISLQQVGAAVQGQLAVDKQESASANWMVAGWRPAVGWVCAAGVAVQFVFGPLATWISGLLRHPVVVPTLDLSTLMTLLLGMLGMGGMRTYEKTKGVQNKH